MQRPRWVRAVPLAVFSLLVPLACGDAFLAGSPGDDGGSDGTTRDGPGGDAPGDDARGDDSPAADDGGGDVVHPDGAGDGSADAPVEAPAPSTVYVSQSTGNDSTNDGLSPAKPKKTIVAGLAAAAQHGLTQVHVCKGVYIETGLNVSTPVSLLGSYDCVTWARTSGYGFPTFDGVNATSVLDANVAVQSAAMLVTGTVGPLSLIDGFSIQGSSSSAGPSVGVQTQDSASPVFSNDKINGGSGKTGAGVGSVGVAIVGASAPEVKDCFVSGGNGSGATGSAAFSVSTTGAPRIHDDVVSGGTGTTSAAGGIAALGISVGSSLTTANGTALTSLLVAGADQAGTTGTTVGVLVAGSGVSADIIGCDINAGDGSGTSSQSFGVLVSTTGGSTRVISDRVYGGLRSGASVQSYGVFGASAADLTVENTMIHAGSTSGTGTTYAVGVAVENVPSATIVDDTIYTGDGPGYAIQLLTAATGVRVTDDFLVGAGATTNIALGAYACTGIVTALDHTAFSNFADVYACTASATVTTTATTLTQLYADLPSVATADVIIEAAASCGADVTCVADPSCPATPTQCLPSLFGASWTTGDDGTGGLFNGTAADGGSTPGGWTLPPGSACAVARGGTPVGGVTTDIFGVARNAAKPTIGAAEYTSGVCN